MDVMLELNGFYLHNRFAFVIIEEEAEGGWKMDNNCKVMCRHMFIDKLRVAAACAVVMLHTVTGVTDTANMAEYPLENTVLLIIRDWVVWCVPVFIMISGYLFLNPAKRITMKDMLFKYCRRILLALFLFGVPFACMEQIMISKSFHISMLGKGIIMVCTGKTWSHMWYLYMLLQLYLITPLLKWIFGKTNVYVPYTMLVFLGVGSSILPFLKRLLGWEWLPVLPDVGIYLFYYICGYLFVRRDIGGKSASGRILAEKRSLKRKLGVIAVVCLLMVMACSRFVGSYQIFMAYNYPFIVILSLLLVWIAWRGEETSKQKNTTRWKNLGGLCFAVYLVHPVFLNLIYKLFHISFLDFPIWISLPGIYLAVLGLSLATAWILCKIPFLKKYIL